MTYRELFEEQEIKKDDLGTTKNIYDKNELKIGKKIETEHKPTYDFIKDYFKKYRTFPPEELVYENISKNHLDEVPDYYTRLLKMEKEAGKRD